MYRTSVKVVTRNDHAVVERIGEYSSAVIDGDKARVAGSEIDVRANLATWCRAYATIDPIRRVTRRSIQVFGADGTAIRKIHEASGTRVAAFAAPVTARAATNQAAGERVAPAAAPAQQRAAAHLIPNTAFCAALEWAAERRAPIHLGVASAGAEQVHHGAIERVERYGPWFNVMDAHLSLHVLEGNIHAAGLVTRDHLESVVALDARSRTIAWVSSAESGWTTLLPTFE